MVMVEAKGFKAHNPADQEDVDCVVRDFVRMIVDSFSLQGIPCVGQDHSGEWVWPNVWWFKEDGNVESQDKF